MLHELFAFPWTGWSFTWPPVVGAYLDCMARQLGHGVALVRSNGKARHDLDSRAYRVPIIDGKLFRIREIGQYAASDLAQFATILITKVNYARWQPEL
jgi:hypothetical protein